MKLSEIDILQIQEKGLTTEEVERQLEIIKRGNIKVNILEAATVGKGIFSYSEDDKKALIANFESRKEKLEITKFIPASGAATRMFKSLHRFVKEFDSSTQTLSEYLAVKDNKNLKLFFQKLEELPFYDDAVTYSRKNHSNFDELAADEQKEILVKIMLFSDGLDLSNYPKGLVPFHKYKNHLATAFEEHLFEAAGYSTVNGMANLHFTVSKGDKEKFEAEFANIRDRLEERTGTKFQVSYSYQNPKTDTIAANEKNEPFRTNDGKLFFRPGGHGALIENLNEQNADLIFIKNIDNVVISDKTEEVAENKKMLGGKLLKLQQQCFSYLELLATETPSTEKLLEISDFLQNELFIKGDTSFQKRSTEEKIQYLTEKLNRPLRVCGMVKNEGEPGGGPFLVKGDNGEISLQIVEGAQIDNSNPKQLKTAREATHFNPVDIVCGVRDYEKKTFDLNQFVDTKASFVANKTKDGKPLKALERPGLWNGGMAKWNTVFVEVPVSTFNPVKTVADLLKPSHQVNS